MRYETLQILRGIAATVVAGTHLVAALEDNGTDWALAFIFTNGGIGVDVFFVLSGFVIYISSSGVHRKTIAEFLANRFWRVVPPYWAVLIFYTLATLLLAAALGDTSKIPSLGMFLKSFFLWPMGPIDYVLIVTWTLSLEILFYALFAITFLRFGAGALFVAMIAWYLTGVASLVISGNMTGFGVPALNPVVAEFLFGIVIARMVLAGNTRYHLICFWIGLVAFTLLLFGFGETGGWMRREWVYGIPCAVLVYGAVGLSWKWPPVLLLWGESSYLLYLVHLPFMAFVGRGIEEITGFSVYSSGFSAIGLLLAMIAFSCLLTLWFERPYVRWYKKRLKRQA